MSVIEDRITRSMATSTEREAARKKAARFKKLFADPAWQRDWCDRYINGIALSDWVDRRRYPRPRIKAEIND